MGLIVTVVLPRLLVLPVVDVGPDEIAYGLIGRELWAGHWPYTTAFDHKPVALYLPYALATGLIGETTTALRVMSLVVAVLSYLVAYAVVRRMRLDPLIATAMASLISLMTFGNQGTAALSENLLNLYLLGMVLMLLLPRGLAASAGVGALAAMTFHTNYLAGPLCAVLGVYLLWRERRHLLRWVAAAVGLVAVSVALLLPIHLWSDLPEYVELQQQYLTNYSMVPRPPGVGLQLWQQFLEPFAPIATACGLLLALVPATRSWPTARWALLLGVAVLAISVNGYFWQHYAILLAMPLTLLLATQLRATPAHRGAAAVVVLCAAVFSFVLPVAKPLADGADSFARQGNLSPDRTAPQSVVAAAVRGITEPGDVIYTRNLHYYYLTGAALPTRFFFPSHHLRPSLTAARQSTTDAEMRAIVAEHPRAVVLDRTYRVPPGTDQVLVDYVRQECRKHLVIDQAFIYDCR